MFTLSSSDRYHLFIRPTDMRKSFDGLSSLVRDSFDRLPQDGEVFAFINKGRDKMKLLHWQGGGFVVYYKRLEEGNFELPRYDLSNGWATLGYAQMVMLVDGLSIKNTLKRKRYQPNI